MIAPDEIMRQLRQRGERLTLQRKLVIEAVCNAGHHHLTVQEIQEHLRQHHTDLNEPTVYRILQWLNDLGIVSQTDLGSGGCVYELIDDEPHHHLICLECGAVIDIGDDALAELRERLRQQYQFQPRIDHMAIFGTCQVCQDNAP